MNVRKIPVAKALELSPSLPQAVLTVEEGGGGRLYNIQVVSGP